MVSNVNVVKWIVTLSIFQGDAILHRAAPERVNFNAEMTWKINKRQKKFSKGDHSSTKELTDLEILLHL